MNETGLGVRVTKYQCSAVEAAGYPLPLQSDQVTFAATFASVLRLASVSVLPAAMLAADAHPACDQ